MGQHVHEIDDRLERGEVGPLERPDPRPAVAQKGAGLGREEVPPMRLGRHHRAEVVARFERRLAGPHQRLGLPAWFRFILGRLEDSQRRGFVVARLDHVGQGPLPGYPLDQFDDLMFLGEAPGQFGMGIMVVALGAHRHEVGDLVLTPRGIVDAGTLAGLFGAGLEPTTVDGHDRQPRGDRYLGRCLLVPEILDPPIPIVPQLFAHFVGDPPHLPLADGDFGLIGEGFRGGVRRKCRGRRRGRSYQGSLARNCASRAANSGGEGKKSRRHAGQ